MKRTIRLSIFLIFLLCSCRSTTSKVQQEETVFVGEQQVHITLLSSLAIYEISTPLSITLEIENESNTDIYLPWGKTPGFNTIVVYLDSTRRRVFALDPTITNTDSHQYLSISPGEKESIELTIPFDLEPGRYNICAEIMIFGISEEGETYETYDAEFGSLKPKICIEILYK